MIPPLLIDYLFYAKWILAAIATKTQARRTHTRIIGQTNLTHFSKSIFATDKLARSDPPVGIIEFEIPSPRWKAKTAVCLEIPTKSDRGVIIGIVVAA